MIILYNGEYVDLDITRFLNWEQSLEYHEYRQMYLGQQFGDFEIVKVDYDWGSRKQVNIARCTRCGLEKEIPDLSAFKRNKGVSRNCICKKQNPPMDVKKPVNHQVLLSEKYKSLVGQTHGGYKLLDYKSGRGFRTECVVCGKQKWIGGKSLFDNQEKCNHKMVTDYSDPKYIGMKSGSLTAIAREGNKIRFRCDCGTEFVREPSAVFSNSRGIKSCGKPDCQYHRAVLLGGKDKRIRGLKFERECAESLKRQGYTVEMTPSSGDYGVDLFATIGGEKVAFQCKKIKPASTISAIQQVYAGGRFYDCHKFVVVCPSGFTYPSENMAQKLGVQLVESVRSFKLIGGKEK